MVFSYFGFLFFSALTEDGSLISPYIHRHVSSNEIGPRNGELDNQAMALYSVVNKQQRPLSNPNGPQLMAANPNSSTEESENNYEDTESEYALELRRQAYLHSMGEHGGYGNIGNGSGSSVYSSLHPPPPPLSAQLMPNQNIVQAGRSPLLLNPGQIGPSSIQPSPVEGPLCASSPKRSMSAFTTFGQQQLHPQNGMLLNPGRPMDAALMPDSAKSTPIPTTGHLV